MGNRTRVEEYKKLREDIENIDVYSFDDPKKMPPSSHSSVPLIPVNDFNDEEDDEFKIVSSTSEEDHVKKNTLTLTIDEIIKQHEAYTEVLQKQELDKRIKEQKEKNKAVFNPKIILWIAIGVIIVVAVVILSLVMAGVI